MPEAMMDCREFHEQLPRYLAEEVEEPLFGRLVAHEASCPDCHRLASESLAGPARVEIEPAAAGRQIEAILARTEGADCRTVALRLADSIDAALPESTAVRVRNHLQRCATCRRMRDMLDSLPLYYEALPRLKASPEFTRRILERTFGPRSGFWDVIRALWRKPEAVWEAAVACAFLGFVLFGDSVPTYREVTERVETGVQGTVERAGLPSVSDLSGTIRQRWDDLERLAVNGSAWAERVGADLRAGDMAGVFEELRLVLEPVGLYPGGETPPVPVEPAEGEQR